jgi:hypothetical protein
MLVAGVLFMCSMLTPVLLLMSAQFETLRMRDQLDGLRDLEERYKRVVEDNRTLYNTVQDLRGNIRVFCRCGKELSPCIMQGDVAECCRLLQQLLLS